MAAVMNTPPRVVMKATALVKRYGQVVALDGTDFELRAGEILAVIGDNGAGKSSLIKALSGATVPDSARSSSMASSPGSGARSRRAARASRRSTRTWPSRRR